LGREWLLGHDLDAGGFTDSKSIIRDVTGLFTLVLTYGAAVTVALAKAKEKPDQVGEWWSPVNLTIAVYVLVSLATIGGLVIVMHAPAQRALRPDEMGPLPLGHAYDWGSIKWARLVVLSALVFTYFMFLAARKGLLPEQAFTAQKQLAVKTVREYVVKVDDKDKLAGIQVECIMGPGDFEEKRVPQQVNLKVRLDKDLPKEWRVKYIEEYELGDKEPKRVPQADQPARIDDPKEPPAVSFWLCDNLAPTKGYVFKVNLVPIEGSPDIPAKLIHLKKDHTAIKVTAFYTGTGK
jgi:hypothetical protein